MLNSYSPFELNKTRNIESFIDYLELTISNKICRVYICFCRVLDNYHNEFLEAFLHNSEKIYFQNFKYNRRISSYLLGRYAAKKAVSSLIREQDLTKINIQNGVFNQPILMHDLYSNLQVSITHCENLGAALAFQDIFIMGIDIESLKINMNNSLEVYLTEYEKSIVNNTKFKYSEFLVIGWTLKEALSKALRTGLTVPLSILEIKSIQLKNGYYLSCYSNFSQYEAISIIENNYVCSITYPKNCKLHINIEEIKRKLSKMLK